MTYHIITTQPDIYKSFLSTGLISRGLARDIINIKIHNLHDFATDAHRSIDDTPYGGGAGMVLKVDVVDCAINNVKLKMSNVKTILLTPQGKPFKQADAKRLAKEKNIILISGRFEGYDERICDLADEEISIGDYVLTSGDLPAMVLIDAVSRQIPGFIEKSESIEIESFNPMLEFPQYTRPETYKNQSVPKILLTGNHAEIKKWRESQSIQRTQIRRPDLKS